MANIKLIPYKLKIKGSNSDYITLDDFTADDRDFKGLIKSFFQQYEEEPYTNESTEKTLRIEEYEENDDIHGRIKSGNFGITADFLDVNTEEEIEELRREENYSEEIPLFFLYKNLDSEDKTALLTLQTLGRFGSKTVFKEAFKKFLAEETERNFSLKLNTVVSQDLWEKLDEVDRVREMELLLHERSVDPASRDVEDYDPKKMKIGYTANWGDSLTVPIEKIKNQINNTERDYIEVEGREAKDIKFKTEIDGADKTLTVSQTESSYSESIVLDRDDLRFLDGHPTKHSILDKAETYSEEVKEKITNN